MSNAQAGKRSGRRRAKPKVPRRRGQWLRLLRDVKKAKK